LKQIKLSKCELKVGLISEHSFIGLLNFFVKVSDKILNPFYYFETHGKKVFQ
jgi:hypothetical protein